MSSVRSGIIGSGGIRAFYELFDEGRGTNDEAASVIHPSSFYGDI